MEIAIRHSDEGGIESPRESNGKGGFLRNQPLIRFLLRQNDDLENYPNLSMTRPQDARATLSISAASE